jgi:sucrose-6F-phosphate phosphohydrolase
MENFDKRRMLATGVSEILKGSSQDAIRRFHKRIRQIRDSVILVYSTGRGLPDIMEDLDEDNLMQPDYVISSAGTEIHRLPGEYPQEEWFQYIRPGFKREEILQFVAEQYPALEYQPDIHQNALKISYLIKDAESQELERLKVALLEADLPAKLVYSSGLYLDIIPERAGTGPALKFLVDSLVLMPNQVFVAGNSGNDIGLFQYGFRGIVVANASYELKQEVELRAYFSHRSYAAGLLEGLEHYRFFNMATAARPRDLTIEGLERAVDSLRRNITPMGFSAASLVDNQSTKEDSNYFSVWSRDGIMTGLWSLSLNDPELTECFRRTLELMAEHQTAIGQIPANVHISTGIPDYSGVGNIASIDSVLWFVIGASRYAAYTGDQNFLENIYPNLKRAMYWLHAHDSNNCGLLEIPESSDWMDLFPRSYNVLYDEVLWYLACKDFSVISTVMGDGPGVYQELSQTIRRKLIRQFWPTAQNLSDALESFSETQFTVGDAQYLLAQISPFGFSWRCDVYANLLACLAGMLDEEKLERIFRFLWGVGANSPYPIKCWYPPIMSGANDWKDYFVTNFLNIPNHYHNGGIWPFIGGLWVRYLMQIGRTELAHEELSNLADACRLGVYGEWEFNEWLHGETGRPMGKAHQAWSAASYVAAWKALHQESVPADFEPLHEEMFRKQ